MSVQTEVDRGEGAPAIRLDGDAADRRAGLRAAAGLFAGFALLAAVDAGAIAITVPVPRGDLALRAAHHVFDAAETLGVGAVAGVIVGLWTWRSGVPRWASAIVYAAAVLPILYAVLGDDLFRQASVALEGRFEAAIFVAYLALTALAIPAAHLLGALFSRYRRLRFVPAAIGLAGMIADHFFLTDDYFGVHGAVAWVAVTLAGASIAPLAERALSSLRASRAGRIAGVAIALIAAFGVLVPPGNAIRLQLFRQPCAVAPWVLASTVWRAPRPRAPAAPPASAWFRDRAALPPVPPTTPPLFPKHPVVVLVTIDAVRAGAVHDPANEDMFPTLTELSRMGTTFVNASAPGSQTAVSLTATFSGRYFSELYWSMHGTGSTRFAYAADDPSPRFPALLSEHGVATATYCSLNFLSGDFGVTRGFREEKMIAEGRRHAYARHMVEPLLERLRRATSEPLFLYVHLMEPHAPYDRGKREGTDYERYLSEIAVADAQIGRVWRFLQQRFPDRGVMIVAADHGEAFGEHATFQHTKTLYDELLRVPLIFRGAGIAPQTIEQRAGLIDLGPTILDMFGVETPATFEGQSLVPLLEGHAAVLERPLLAEGRLRRALYAADGLKVIEDQRRKTIEVYDLARDPDEKTNLFDVEPSRVDPAVAALDAFFAAHALRRRGYTPPYKP